MRNSISRRKFPLARAGASSPRAFAALVLVLLLAPPAAAQRCLHGPDESASERARREAAIEFAAEVNAAEGAAQRARGTYVALTDAVALGRVPLGFVPRLTFDRWSYVLSLKDLFDPCGFALFSDQDGQIYEGRPVARSGEPGGPAPEGPEGSSGSQR
jgi:hypothetical protein